MDINEGSIETKFVPFAQRELYEVDVDISGISENKEIEQKRIASKNRGEYQVKAW